MEMESTPINCSQTPTPTAPTKSASRLARTTPCSVQGKDPPPHLDLVVSPSPKKPPPYTSSASSLPLRELLLLSPSPSRKPRVRLADRIDMAAAAAAEEGEPTGSRRRSKNRGSQVGGLGCASPRNTRRLRRRTEVDYREERDLIEELGKPRRRKTGGGGRSRKEKLSSSVSAAKADDYNGSNLDRLAACMHDLVMWEDVAKSSLWFGVGCLCFLSSCFAKGINFRNNNENEREVRLREEDILRLGRLILPAANLAISKTRKLFSGEPSMTLKVIPFLLLGAEYGHFITLRRLFALGFFVSFTIPKLYSCYSNQITQKVDNTKCRMLETWGCCSHKKIVTASAVTAFWNLSSVRTRIFTVFIVLVILRCCRQHIVLKKEEDAAAEEEVLEEKEAAAEVVREEDDDAAEEDIEEQQEEQEEEALMPLVLATDQVKSLTSYEMCSRRINESNWILGFKLFLLRSFSEMATVPEKKKPVFVKVGTLTPGTTGHNLTVKVVESKDVPAPKPRRGPLSLSQRPVRPTRIAECLVGDDTGSIVFTARNEQVDLMTPGATVILRNAKIDMFKGTMRLAVDKWGRVEVTEPAEFEVKEGNNLSLIEYELVNV
ncbi:Reticulon-like protein B17 [Linum perenne]